MTPTKAQILDKSEARFLKVLRAYREIAEFYTIGDPAFAKTATETADSALNAFMSAFTCFKLGMLTKEDFGEMAEEINKELAKATAAMSSRLLETMGEALLPSPSMAC